MINDTPNCPKTRNTNIKRRNPAKKTYEGGFHIQSTEKSSQCTASKRSSIQTFGCS